MVVALLTLTDTIELHLVHHDDLGSIEESMPGSHTRWPVDEIVAVVLTEEVRDCAW